jgi:phosphopantetheinyl transferase (holo-ACP synthase)
LLGTDVVDLADPEAAEGALHPRFDERAFTAAERARLAGSPERARLRWALWAAKEAAWKAARAAGGDAPFRPASIETALAPRTGGFEGTAALAGAGFRVRVEAGWDALLAVARAAELDEPRVFATLARLRSDEPEAQSAGARALGLALAGRALGASPERLALVRRGRRPELRLDGAPAGAVVSLSHHGRFAAAVLALLPGRRA